MKTQNESGCVADSRRWREETSRVLDAMSTDQRLDFLESLRKPQPESLATVGKAPARRVVSSTIPVVREESPADPEP